MKIHGTTVLALIKDGIGVIGADGQATFGQTIIKQQVKKVRRLKKGILAGFAGGTADALTLLERFESHLEQKGGVLASAAVALAKEWRTDRYLRRLEAMLIVLNNKEGYLISGSGDVIAPEQGILAIGSGAMYAQAAAIALMKHTQLTPKEIVHESLKIAADICIYTNHHFTILTTNE